MTELNQTSDTDLTAMLTLAEEKKAAQESNIKKIKHEIATRKQAEIDVAYKAKDEPYGDITLDIGGRKFKITKPKKVDWDQKKLEAVANQIAADGADVKEYVDIEFNVPESRWKAWGENLKSHFIDARTVTPGNLSIKLLEEKGE